jgi:hypothetical protein
MAFDPARVWIHTGGTRRHVQAIMALRSAIHLVSRKQVYAITLHSRDILVVDNLRAMIARREDTAAVSWPNIWISMLPKIIPLFPDYSGWWLRLVFGYPRADAGHDSA